MPLRLPRSRLPDKVPIDMTPMIDVVFQLLTFFCMTLRLVSAEGDFSIKMPQTAPQAGRPDPNQAPPLKVRLRADDDGNLVELSLNDRVFSGADRFQQLHEQIATIVNSSIAAAAAEVELDCDFGLKYEHVIEAITAISGAATPDGQIIKLIEKIKFAPPRQE